MSCLSTNLTSDSSPSVLFDGYPYPGYPDNITKTFPIVAPAGYEIEIFIRAVSLEQGFDFLTIVDGQKGSVIARLTGEIGSSAPPILVESNRASIVFTSDESNNDLGFILVTYFRAPGKIQFKFFFTKTTSLFY